MIEARRGYPSMTAHKIEIITSGPDGHTTFDIEARDRSHRDALEARVREAIDGAPPADWREDLRRIKLAANEVHCEIYSGEYSADLDHRWCALMDLLASALDRHGVSLDG